MMLVRRVAVENVRSFLDRSELLLDGMISILIGPNGGGKTNLLDIAVVMLRRYLFASMYPAHAPSAEQSDRYEFRANDVLNSMSLERHSKAGPNRDQLVEIEVEVTDKDIENMLRMRRDAGRIVELASKKYANVALLSAPLNIEALQPGTRVVYRLVNGGLHSAADEAAKVVRHYLQVFEIDGALRQEFGLAPLSTPLVYLPVNRGASGFSTTVELAAFNDFETKRQVDGTSSRSGTQIVSLAIARLAQKYRLLLEKDQGKALSEFKADANLVELTALLKDLGYEWTLETVNPLKNQYDVRLSKQGTSFLVGAASSGERELLTYLFAIFALNVRDALIIVDEPELHLHPKWQKTLLRLFVRLSQATGNQFLMATHSPTFVSPESIQYVSRVFSVNQQSRVLRLNASQLPEAKHLLNIVNSQNNERLFFADNVVLVEGLSDRMFFEAVLDHFGRSSSRTGTTEVISVGGKGLFAAYARVLTACHIPYALIADRDYVEQVGTPEIKALFRTDNREIRVDVLENIKSSDGDTLVKAIEEALVSESWETAQEVWTYIKSRRIQLKPDLDDSEAAMLATFLSQKRAEKVFILQRGALEAYLPVGYRSKDLEKLIRLVADAEFWSRLPDAGKAELESIATSILVP
jgi:putative ATP-dependent endonuclease of the OLD family